MDSNTVTAGATVVLAIITAVYVYYTQKLLNETQIARKINAIEKKLEKFYIPLQQYILINQYVGSEEKIRNETVNANFMRYMYLCQKDEIRSNLKSFLDPRSNIQSQLINSLSLVNKDIETLEKELNTLQDKK